MNDLKLPQHVTDIDATWLTDALGRGGVIAATVANVGADVIGVGSGFAGELARLTLEYAPGSSGPATLIAKGPAADPGARAFFLATGIYATEVGFYRDLAPAVPLRVPRCYFSALDAATGEFSLLLEDLAPARVGDQVASCSRAEAESAVEEMARLHAAFWESPKLSGIDWLRPVNDPDRMRFFTLIYGAVLAQAMERGRGLFSPLVEKVASALGGRLTGNADRLSRAPVTLVHGDYRLDNLLYDCPDGAPLAAIDWQAASRGRGPLDLAYFLNGSLTVADRRAWQEDLIRLYLEGLAKGGVRDYGRDDCLLDIRLALLQQLPVLILLTSAADLTTQDRTGELGRTSIERTNAMFEDTDFGDVLS